MQLSLTVSGSHSLRKIWPKFVRAGFGQPENPSSGFLKAREQAGAAGRPGQSPVIAGRNRGEKGEERTI
ncbi:MAG TPA: hypothetical protein PKM06_05100 [Bacillota bacterium]|nr:hypothetical protein [Bacillota bacterium]